MLWWCVFKFSQQVDERWQSHRRDRGRKRERLRKWGIEADSIEAERGEEQKIVWDREFSWQSPWSAAHSRKINGSGFLFLFFQPVNYLQIIEKQLFSHFPRTRPVWLRIEWQPRQTSSSHSNCSDNAFSVTHSHMRLMKQIRHQDYNDKVIFIKSFFVVRFFFLLVIAAPTRVFTKKWPFCRKF